MIMKDYIQIFEDFLKKEINYNAPANLYEPVKYILDSGGKRLRPLIVPVSYTHLTLPTKA